MNVHLSGNGCWYHRKNWIIINFNNDNYSKNVWIERNLQNVNTSTKGASHVSLTNYAPSTQKCSHGGNLIENNGRVQNSKTTGTYRMFFHVVQVPGPGTLHFRDTKRERSPNVVGAPANQHHLFWKPQFLPRLAGIRHLPQYEVSPHIPEYCPFSFICRRLHSLPFSHQCKIASALYSSTNKLISGVGSKCVAVSE